MKLTNLLSKALEYYSPTSGKQYVYNQVMYQLLPATKFDFRDSVGNVYDNPVVSACINFVYRKLTEAELAFFEKDPNTDKWIKVRKPNTLQREILDKLNNPNPYYTMDCYMYGILVSFAANGKGYLYKLRNKQKQVQGYMYVSHTFLEEVRESKNLIDYYEFRNKNGQTTKIPKEDIIPLIWGHSPTDPNHGMPIFRAALKDIALDNEAATAQAALYRNNGIPGTLLSPKVANAKPANKDQRKDLRTLWAEFVQDKLGGVLPMPLPVDVTQLGFTNEQMQIGASRDQSAGRIASVYGLDIMVLGLPSDNKTYSNFGEALDAAIEHSVIPQLTLITRYLNKDLSLEYGYDTDKMKLGFDLDEVRGLQEDKDNYHNRVRSDWKAGLLTYDVVAKLLGYPDVPEYAGKNYFDIKGKNNDVESAEETDERPDNTSDE